MRTLIKVAAVLALAANYHSAAGRVGTQNVSASQSVTDVRERPLLGIDYSGAARLKLASRKDSYRFGEMIGLDIALLNATDTPIFFHKLSGPTVVVKVFDEKGAVVKVIPGSVRLEGVVPQSYVLLGAGEVTVGSRQLLAGCNAAGLAAFDEARQRLNEDVGRQKIGYDQGMFERGLFVNWGDVCAQTTRPGSYDIVVEVSNRHVVLSGRGAKVKTAVSTISSPPLRITISE
ncbi:MAG: hypothetical protein JOZ96_05970 [Acidobacteria bacterium]|nr:hypothetical protein [Acidobacteriota bacterium]